MTLNRKTLEAAARALVSGATKVEVMRHLKINKCRFEDGRWRHFCGMKEEMPVTVTEAERKEP